MTNYLCAFERNFHSLITQYPLGRGFPNFHITALSIIPLAGAYLYYRIYKNPPTNPNKIDPSFLPNSRNNAIKLGDKIMPLVEKKQEEAFSFLPKRPPENETKISADIITKVIENTLLNTRILESLKLAFQNKFKEAKESLEMFKKDLQCSPEEMQEISRVVEREKHFIDQLEIISQWSALEPFNDLSSKGLFSPAGKSWEKAMQAAFEKRDGNRVSFFSLIEIGLSRGWFTPASKERYEIMFDKIIDEVNQRLEQTWMHHLMNRVYHALGSSQRIDIHPNGFVIPLNAKDDEILNYSCKLAKYFHGLGNHEKLLEVIFNRMFLILKTNPINVDECSRIFTLVLSCFTSEQKDAMKWALNGMKSSILENSEEAPQKKIQLLLGIQNDYKILGDVASSNDILDKIIELIKDVPQGKKKPWVEKTALALYQMQLFEVAQRLITTHNASIKELADPIPLIQSISLGVLALFTFFVRPFYPLCACLIVPLVPTVLGATADSKQHRT